ncbi:helix-turn-helix domain-containing protein [Paraburkholderia strydomiana]|jgi:transcriptional regulator with XRE-family HTH domain|uniref:helix-turn-helix domain-containing protein n=1 Tax=Paraburkholderia strydomiana TaxID=1245417 RepID=UPI00285C2361|nr:helix-turn-helix transcriptional regulator [Paraburkholderia strydomiana]MDR7008794.1 transcriptional regulator with XRE-family HTH domain [Paraburkholderia strydomiana]
MTKPTPARALLSENLKRYRTRLGVSQVELSLAAGLARNTVYYIEKKSPSVHLETIDRLAISLDVDPCVLLSQESAATDGQYQPRPLADCVVDNLRRFRARLNLTQEEVATSAGLARNYVYKIERKHVSVTLDTIDAVAHALGVLPWQLLA